MLVRIAALLAVLSAFAAEAKPSARPPAKKQVQKSHAAGHPRLSAWVDMPIDPVYATREKGPLTDPAKRARYGKNIIGGKGIIDDLSLISTVNIALKGTGVSWSPYFVPGLGKKRAQYLKDIISIAHEKGIQVMCGYAIGDTDKQRGDLGKAFVKLMDTTDPAVLYEHADNLMKFVFEDNGLEFDGISFDLEINGLQQRHAPNMTRFFHYLAGKLQARGGKILSYATGVGGDKGNAIKLQTLGSFMAQPFSIAKGYQNIIARPMAYDVQLKEPDLFAWHANISKYAQDQGLKPAQFQLGVKTLGNSGGNVTQAALVAKRGKEILKPRGQGLIIFAMSKNTDWNRYKTYRAGLTGE